ncbi:MAG: mannose-phosphate guanylyltransferase [Thermosediminibacterales bacterium]|nr:mannose-phosphate guanylyltransferase [Thermosediminibacterales bacterium]MDK2835613.1 mannose-phosphate guanylyltransferase [Thermosediminibacterales bacterium]
MMLTAVIMAGGKGERFWPKSRTKLPKQLLKLFGNETMIQQTVNRLTRILDYEDIYIVTNKDYAEAIAQQLPLLPEENIIVEPMGKNTAPCIGLAALHIERKDPEAVMIVLPSDHLIKEEEKFLKTIKAAAHIAKEGENLVTLGINPTRPETGYGYIQAGKKIKEIEGNQVFKVQRFVEKPNLQTAKKYINSGDYLWNSGMFIWKVSTILQEIKKHMPELYSGLVNLKRALGTEEEDEVLEVEYSKFNSISIDYGIMEKADSIFVIPGDFGWDDVGSWTSLERIYEKDKNGNIMKGNIVSLDTEKCIIEANGKLIATLGVKNLIVVDTEDATLICSKDKAQEIKRLLQEVKRNKLETYL